MFSWEPKGNFLASGSGGVARLPRGFPPWRELDERRQRRAPGSGPCFFCFGWRFFQTLAARARRDLRRKRFGALLGARARRRLVVVVCLCVCGPLPLSVMCEVAGARVGPSRGALPRNRAAVVRRPREVVGFP